MANFAQQDICKMRFFTDDCSRAWMKQVSPCTSQTSGSLPAIIERRTTTDNGTI